jgi:hypothetical protein
VKALYIASAVVFEGTQRIASQLASKERQETEKKTAANEIPSWQHALRNCAFLSSLHRWKSGSGMWSSRVDARFFCGCDKDGTPV